MKKLDQIQNIHQLAEVAKHILSEDAWSYLEGGADDGRTANLNCTDFQNYYIKPRRLVDVSKIDTRLNLFDIRLNSPIIIAPVGFQRLFHVNGEIATALAASSQDRQMIVSTVSNHSYEDISMVSMYKPWFQLYPTSDLNITEALIKRIDEAGCEVLVLTIDAPVLGNREGHNAILDQLNKGKYPLPNFEGIRKEESITNPSLNWDFIKWVNSITKMKIVLKGIMTSEDALIAKHSLFIKGIIVSNHGGRQLESDFSTINALQEIAYVVNKTKPIIFDGGIRRGTDIFKALALGADAVCVGRSFLYGLASFGQQGVEKSLEILQNELEHTMRLAGTPSLKTITNQFARLR